MGNSPSGDVQPLPKPKQLALNLDPFDDIRFKVLVRVGDSVNIGQPLVESKTIAGQRFVSPAGGTVAEIRRGLKRRLLDIVIDVADSEQSEPATPYKGSSKEDLLTFFMERGLFPHIRMRPFDLVASPHKKPRAIFVKAIESQPFVPPAEMQVSGNESHFQAGLEALATLAPTHLVYNEKSDCDAFLSAQGVEKHTARGPNPIGSASLHIHKISPIQNHEEVVWTLSVVDVITVGMMVKEGRYFTKRIIGLGGDGVSKPGFYSGRAGHSFEGLSAGRLTQQLLTFISGDPLTGSKIEEREFLGFYHTAFSVIPVNTKRQMFHFLRIGFGKFSATRAYVSSLFTSKKIRFTTNQHGEERAFIDGAIYNKVMPMRIPTMHLVKAILAEDYELAEQLGLLEVAPEDFALPTFICPSKIEMVEIVKQGLHRYSKEMGF